VSERLREEGGREGGRESGREGGGMEGGRMGEKEFPCISDMYASAL
jgi:myosin-crossreactive antigen